MSKLYNLEKVLFLANRDVHLHVAATEHPGNDLSKIVRKALSKKYLVAVEDKSTTDKFYKTTKEGEIELLKLQIKYRIKNNKPYHKEIDRLQELASEQMNYVPNYMDECEVCSQTPTVNISVDNVIVHKTGMCGPCTFGEAKCIQPENW